jgi:hypothetical protein
MMVLKFRGFVKKCFEHELPSYLLRKVQRERTMTK